jgi:Tol biopolymer transport system component
MPLATGSRLGPYEILAAIGAGGMGEVYRARDSRLDRTVAIKVVPDAFARDAERMARFEREAKLLASLNHPNIAAIYGLEDSGNTRALVMELVEGPTLADRIKSGPLPIDEANLIAKQIAEGLEYAHERGVVHRDLKPANIKVSRDDSVKILDFGLAKAIEGEAVETDIGTSPTLTRMATQAGFILGTAAYMSPEQAKGKPVDRRADIWAFGCVLYEMLTAKMPFHGETVTDTLAAVVRAEPDWSRLPAATPPHVRVLLQRCLQKDPKQRLRDIGDARISIDEVLSGAPEPSSVAATPVSVPFWRRALAWTLFGVTAVALATLAFVRFREKPAVRAEVMRFEIPMPEKTAQAPNGVFSVSPDGRQLAFFAAGSDGVYRVWVRTLGSLEARPLPGSESPQFPPFFWSPDSRYIAFDAGRKLKKVDISGGPPQTVCDLGTLAVGGSWNRDGVIIFGTAGGGVMRVSAGGGSASPLTTLDSSRGEIQHVFPSFLPDGRHFIYLRRSSTPENSGVYVGSIDAKPEEQDLKRLLATAWGPSYVPSSDPGMGQLLFVRDGTLMSQPFDAHRLELVGEPVTVAEQVGFFLDFGFFSASTNGVLVYRTGGSGGTSQLTWFDRQGKALGTVGEPGYTTALFLSPDGTRAAVSRRDSPLADAALWLLDLSRGTSTRFTFGPSSASVGMWSPDSSRIIFNSNPSVVFDLYEKPASGVKDEELLLKSSESKSPTSWSRDGRFLLYETPDPKTGKSGLWVLPLDGDKKPFPFLRTEFNNYAGQFSPDGHWAAYVSDESGRNEIYVRTFSPGSSEAAADAGGKWLISANGGSQPRWRGDGKELYYLAPDDKLMAVEIATSPVFRAGVPKALFQTLPHAEVITAYEWDVTPDGKRLAYLVPTKQGAAPFTVVLNWQAGLKK